jgi:hypothetical protein
VANPSAIASDVFTSRSLRIARYCWQALPFILKAFNATVLNANLSELRREAADLRGKARA